jgi:hypothetical protein
VNFKRSHFLLLSFLALACLTLPLPLFAQGCALCYTQAASAGARMIHALQSGILILVIPSTLGSVGMIFILRQKRNQVRRRDHEHTTQDW